MIVKSVAVIQVLVFLFAFLAIVPRVSSEGTRGASQKERELQGGTNRYIVKYKNAQGKAVAQVNAFKVNLELKGFNAISVDLPDDSIESLMSDPDIEFVELDQKRTVDPPDVLSIESLMSDQDIEFVELDQKRSLFTSETETIPYGISQVQATLLSENKASGIKVCIIDSGYDYGHPDLATSGVTGYNGNLPWSTDGCGHGTHVAVSQNKKIEVCKVPTFY